MKILKSALICGVLLAGCGGSKDSSDVSGARVGSGGDPVKASCNVSAVKSTVRECRGGCVLATAISADPVCENCNTIAVARSIRCESRGCVCGNADYLNSLVLDLASGSWRIRRAATIGLRRCRISVDHENTCVAKEETNLVAFNKFYGDLDGFTSLIAEAQSSGHGPQVVLPKTPTPKK